MASFMEVLQTSRRSPAKLLYHPAPTASLYQAIFLCRATTKKIQRVTDTINNGTLGPVTTPEIVPPFFKNKPHGTEMVRGTCPTIYSS